jgi:hypothetical protein
MYSHGLQDIIGYVAGKQSKQTCDGKTGKTDRINIMLKDLDGESMQVTLWSDDAVLIEQLMDNKGDDPLVTHKVP